MRLVFLLLLFFFKNLLLILTICDIKMIFDVHSYHYRRAIGHFSHRAETDRSVQDLVLFQMLIFCSFSRRETPGSSRTHYSHEQVVRLYIPDTIIHCRIRAHRRQWQNGRKSFGRKKKKRPPAWADCDVHRNAATAGSRVGHGTRGGSLSSHLLLSSLHPHTHREHNVQVLTDLHLTRHEWRRRLKKE